MSNKAISYAGPGKVEVIDTAYPEFELKDGPGVNPANVGRKVAHGAILAPWRRTSADPISTWCAGARPLRPGLVLGHEITGEVVEVGPGVEFIKVGDIVSVPFNIACGRCRTARRARPASASTSIPIARVRRTATSTWAAGSADRPSTCSCRMPIGTSLKFPDRDQALEKILDLTMLSDIFPTGFHGAVTAGVGPGSDGVRRGCGPRRNRRGRRAQLLGRGLRHRRRSQRRSPRSGASIGCETVDVSKGDPRDQIAEILGTPEVDAASTPSDSRRADTATTRATRHPRRC